MVFVQDFHVKAISHHQRQFGGQAIHHHVDGCDSEMTILQTSALCHRLTVIKPSEISISLFFQ